MISLQSWFRVNSQFICKWVPERRASYSKSPTAECSLSVQCWFCFTCDKWCRTIILCYDESMKSAESILSCLFLFSDSDGLYLTVDSDICGADNASVHYNEERSTEGGVWSRVSQHTHCHRWWVLYTACRGRNVPITSLYRQVAASYRRLYSEQASPPDIEDRLPLTLTTDRPPHIADLVADRPSLLYNY